jgi:hypothetical protein
LYQSSQPAVAYLTSERACRASCGRRRCGCIRSLKKPMIVSIKALLNASPTLPMDGPMPSSARCSVNRIETSDALRVSSCEGLWLVERCGFGIEDACAEAVV